MTHRELADLWRSGNDPDYASRHYESQATHVDCATQVTKLHMSADADELTRSGESPWQLA